MRYLFSFANGKRLIPISKIIFLWLLVTGGNIRDGFIMVMNVTKRCLYGLKLVRKRLLREKNFLIFYDDELDDGHYYIRAEDEFLVITYLSEYSDTIIDTLLSHSNIQHKSSWMVKGIGWDSDYLIYEASYVGRKKK